MNAEEQEQQVQLDFKVIKHPENTSAQGVHYSFVYPRFTIQARLESPWKLSSLAIVHPEEGELTPESISEIKLFQLLSAQYEKIYYLYDCMTDFPLGLVLCMAQC